MGARRSGGHDRIGRALRAFSARRRLQTAGPARHDRHHRSHPDANPIAALVAERLFSRLAGAANVEGNALALLRDGEENYGSWLEAIGSAQRYVHFENYIVRNDPVGARFAVALAAKAREGVPVRVLYDWLGCLTTSRRYWRNLRLAGVEVRCFNRPSFDSPFGWLSRNHRKSIGVDGRVGYVAGLCVGQAWVGNPAHGVAPWRDTGVEVRGPAVADLDAAFAESWAFAGPPLAELKHEQDVSPAGSAGQIGVRVVASKPNTMGIYRLDQVIAGMARRSLWLTDAYFVGTTAYVRTLCAAARDGVDVRLLVPGSSDIIIAKALSRAGYRPLLEAGVRVFEWNGPMLHAKTAVADGRWARIGSSNLNLASWRGNWELDIAVEDEEFAQSVEDMFRSDLAYATEILLKVGGVHAAVARPPRDNGRGSPGRLRAGAVGVANTATAAITDHRALGPAEAVVMAAVAGMLLLLVGLAVWVPLLVIAPLSILAVWVAVTLLVRAIRLRFGEETDGTTDQGSNA